jgi:8-oxo-dGTP pyrophosphatase MutT (NUDIX family)
LCLHIFQSASTDGPKVRHIAVQATPVNPRELLRASVPLRVDTEVAALIRFARRPGPPCGKIEGKASVYVDAATVARLAARYGAPRELQMELTMVDREFALCRRAADRGRAHDVTLFVLRAATHDAPRWAPEAMEIAVIRKWSYPPGLFRPPSGGVEPGEAFEAGAAREAYEETGLTVELERYLVRVQARFLWGEEALDWTTHVFSARPLAGEVRAVDTREIAEARWATVAELDTELRARMLARESAGFQYRVALQDAALEVLGLKRA